MTIDVASSYYIGSSRQDGPKYALADSLSEAGQAEYMKVYLTDRARGIGFGRDLRPAPPSLQELRLNPK